MTFVQAKHYRVGRIKKIRLMVLHDMEAPEKGNTAEAVAAYFARVTRPASAHYCIDNNSVVQCVRDKDTAFAAPGANADGIQFEMAGYASQTRRDWADQYSLETMVRTAKLVAAKCREYRVVPQYLTDRQLADGRTTGIVTHAQVSRVFKQSTHTDPGKNFPAVEFLKLVSAEYSALGGAKKPKSYFAAVAAALGVAVAAVIGAGVTVAPDAPKPKPSVSSPAPSPSPSASPSKPSTTPKPSPRPLPAPTYPGTKAGIGVGDGKPDKREAAWVVKIQKRLNALGYRSDDGKRLVEDGQFGQKTKQAVVKFQKAKKIKPVDGIVGPVTWKGLFK